MRYRLFLVISLLCAFLFIYQSSTLASLQIGFEYQPMNEQPNTQALQIGYQFTNHWELRGALELPDNSLSAGVIREFETATALAPYLGIGLRDLNGKITPELSISERAEIITGLNLKIVAGLSLAVEARITPDDLSGPGNNFNPEIGVSLNYRFPSPGAYHGNQLPVTKVTRAERRLLAKLVTAEAPGEPFNGQVAVVAVVINRVKSDRFPDTIRDVIYQPGQFNCRSKLSRITPDASAYKAVDEALQGVDPSRGAHYFYNPATASPAGRRFFRSDDLLITARIGNHVFLKLT